MAELTLEQVSKRFNANVAVSELSLRVGDGEFVVLLGPTGAGKTTTLRLVAGLEQPDQGQLYLDGQDITRQPTAARDMAFVFQQYSLYPHYSVYDNLAFPLRSPLRRQSEAAIRQRVGDIAALLHIEDKLNNRATALSGGEMQRVAIGRALVRSPKLFLMDEPLSSLDAKLRDELRIELKRIQIDLGATVLYVTHDQTEAMTLADRIGVLADGRLVQLGSPEQVYAEPHNVQVAQRLGSPPINLLPVTAITSTISIPGATAQVGARPEDILISPGGADTVTDEEAFTLAAKVIQVEHLGAETIVVVDTRLATDRPRRLHILAEPDTVVHPGDRVTLYVSPNAALFFNADGKRLAHRD